MPGTPDSGSPDTILAIDYGQRRIGVAVGQNVTGSANPIGVIRNGDDGPDWVAFERILADWTPARIVVGMPLAVDGSSTEMSGHVTRFIDTLARYRLPVETVDERYTSHEAEELLKGERALGIRGRISRDMIDAAAAVLIAERWLDRAARGA